MVKEQKQLSADRTREINRLHAIFLTCGITDLAFAAYVGTGKRFTNLAQVSNFIGLVPRIDISCTQVHYGGITKKGNITGDVLL